MNPERTRIGAIYSELDTAFGTVQAARLRHEMGYEDAQKMALECVAAAAARVNRKLLKEPVSPADARLIEAKLNALMAAAARIPGPAAREQQPPKPAAALGR